MNRPTLYITAFGAALISLAAIGIGAAVDMPSTLMSRVDFKAGTKAIEAQTRGALAGCRNTQGVAKDICKAEAWTTDRVKKADLEALYYGTVAAAERAQATRSRAGRDLAKARCGIETGDARIECLRLAREDRDGIADAKLASK
jgi:hypothetical protein